MLFINSTQQQDRIIVVVCVFEQDGVVKVASVFHNLTYWNLEIPPSSDDGVVRAMEWPTLADAVSFRP